MPDLPGQAPHQRRDFAESFGVDPERYDRTRPTYPTTLVDAVMAASPEPVGRVRTVLDVGIGTGLSARPFRDAGCTVLGIDADERMAQAARRRGFEVEVSRFEQWDPAGRMFDIVIAGQSWHWIDPLAGAFQAARVVRPGGLVAIFCNAGDPDPEIAAAFAQIYHDADTGLPFTPFTSAATQGYISLGDSFCDALRTTGAFTEPRRWRSTWDTTMTRDAWLDQVPSTGSSHQIPPQALTQILAAMAATIDALGGSFTMHYTTLATLAHRI
ncbi:MAG: class I SAM-dependent methyltransferase [Micrococcales bacterium]|nr:class I SAM-dependent methyltransferase [Micrococcales bacterium]